ncbi:recombinase family protein [Micromonospora sp. HUAS LYJ1]|uniref:recombinase family protein n=1 Tax=Micromonospora sp. HUAS LYJ1 TaxID=3061626 RepID=UPI0026716CB4|nr:recombinase family protein [Micromonospora sp. HUAS LYJ1]WKU03863.1 recombinase family protein [Micromonospora sp. HUAS LYJ1]
MTDSTQERAAVYGRQSRGKAKSIGEQLDAGAYVIAAEGWEHAGNYQDGTSASRSARTVRDDWQRILADIAVKAFTVLIMWESSRGDRTPETWFAFLSLCRAQGVRIHIISHERTYDLSLPRDWKTLAEEGVSNAYETELLSLRVRRGHAGSAAAGRPSHGRTPYGYRRTYDPATGELVGQVADETTAPVVREIVARIAKGDAISTIVNDLNARQVPTIGAKAWYRQRVIDIARNVAYVGIRVLNDQQFPGDWPAIVEPAVFWETQAILSNPARITTRPGRQKHLLSYLGTCGPCGSNLTAVRGRYRCLAPGCVTIVQAPTDDMVTRMVLSRLARPDAYTALRQAGADSDREVLAARKEAAELTAKLDEWRLSAALGETSPASLAVIEADLTRKIRTAERRAEHASIPPALRQILEPGTDVRVRWDAAPLPARREVIRALAVIKVDQASSPGGRNFEPERLGPSRWVGDKRTWAEIWAESRDGE